MDGKTESIAEYDHALLICPTCGETGYLRKWESSAIFSEAPGSWTWRLVLEIEHKDGKIHTRQFWKAAKGAPRPTDV